MEENTAIEETPDIKPSFEGRDPNTGRFLPSNCLATKNAYYQDPVIFEQAIEDYFNLCEAKDQPPMVTALALHMGFTNRQAFHNYENNTLVGKNPFVAPLKRARARIEAERMAAMLKNKNNVIAGIFDLKNNHGYIDKQVQETDIRVQQSFTPEDREDLKALALQMIEEREGDPLLIEEERQPGSHDGISDGTFEEMQSNR
jgi:hypothetical protein